MCTWSTRRNHIRQGQAIQQQVLASTSSPEYGFCSDLTPSVEEKVMSLEPSCTDADSWTAPPTPTTSCRAELLTAMRTAHLASTCLAAVLSVTVCTRFSHGANANELMVSNSSISMSLSASAT